MKAFRTLRIVILASLSTSCRLIPTPSDTKALNAGKTISQDVSNGVSELVIFYGNETPDTDVVKSYYKRIDQVLADLQKSEPNPVYDKIRNGYAQDIGNFPVQIRKDAAGLKHTICESNSYPGTGLFVFTNELARQGKFEFCLPAPYSGIMTADLEITVPAEHKGDFRYTQSPLAMPSSLESARAAIQRELQIRELPEADFSYVWISKSHGGQDMVITPKLLHPIDKMSDADLAVTFRKVALAADFSGIPLTDLTYNGVKLSDLKVGDIKFGDLKMSDLKMGDLKMGDLKMGDLKMGDLKMGDLKMGDLKMGDLKMGDLKMGDLKMGDLKMGDLKYGDLKMGDLKMGDLKMGDLKMGDLTADDEGIEPDSLGISKDTFVTELKAFNLPFPVVFLESCSSVLPESLIVELQEEAKAGSYKFLGDIFTSDRQGLKFETVNYSSLPPAGNGSFAESLKGALDKVAASTPK